MMGLAMSSIYNLVQGVDPTFLQTPMALPKILWLALLGRIALGTVTDPTKLDACPGYKVTHAKSTASSLSADLILAGGACNVFGKDVSQLKLDVTYETSKHPPHLSLLSAHVASQRQPPIMLSPHQNPVSTSELQIHLLNDTKSPSLYSLAPTRITQQPRGMLIFGSTIPPLLSHFQSIEHPLLRFYSPLPRILSFSNLSIFE